MASLHTLAFEIGTEEIPAFDLHKATAQLEKLVPEALDAVRIPHGAVSVHTTPRRLIVLAEDVADETEALQEVFRGPSAKIAFDAEGKPTKAAIGFARGKGLDVDALERREENGAEYVFAERSVPARDVAELLPGVLEGVITGISWPKSCRWGTRGEYFSRPVRWLVALLDERGGARGVRGPHGRQAHARPPLPGPRPARGGRGRRPASRGGGRLRGDERAGARAAHPRGRGGGGGPDGLPRRAAREDAPGGGEPLRVSHGARGRRSTRSSCAFPRRSSWTPCSCTSAISRCTTGRAGSRTSSSS